MSLINTLMPSASRAAGRSDNADPQNDLGPAVQPVFEVQENSDAYGVTVYLPGVSKDGLDITAEAGQLRIVGRRNWKQPENWTAVYRESNQAPFELVLTHDNAIDSDKIVAELNDGVLRASLPKHEAVKPRKIAVN